MADLPGINFSVSVYGDITQENEVLSKSRVRIFYKGKNRNCTYITDEFADYLLSSLPYTPVKGIYSASDGGDFTDHGTKNEQGRIYGIVPENPNITWEMHLDADGVERRYACADVLLFTGLYEEAKNIAGKSQSMELFPPSLTYHEAIIDGQKYIVFEEGKFFGLQVLGDKVEPCFESASFYALQSDELREKIESIITEIKNYSMAGGEKEMSHVTFKISDDEKYSALWNLLNSNFNEEGDWTIDYQICDVYDDYALVYNCKERKYERAYYTKDDAENKVEITSTLQVYVMDVTEKEKATLDTLRELNGGTYELVNENLTNAEENAKNCADYEAKIVEKDDSIVTLQVEVAAFQTDMAELKDKYTALTEEKTELEKQIADLTSYKAAVENQQKEAILTDYVNKLSEEVIDAYKEKLDEFSIVDLDKELAYELKKTNPSIFSQQVQMVLKDTPLEGIEAVLVKYRDK